MKRLKIGIFPFSSSLNHPADRRRLVFWAKARNHELVIGEYRNVDLIFISERSDFLELSRIKGPPRVFDLIDGYLSPQQLPIDFMRGALKCVVGQHRTYPRTYTSIVKEACKHVDLVICSSPEQRKKILHYNSNVHTILDNHSEFPLMKFRRQSQHLPALFWEGTTYTLRGLEKLLKMVNLQALPINIVTDLQHSRILGKYMKQDVHKRLSRRLPNYLLHLHAWSAETVISHAVNSDLAILPINSVDKLQLYKPENRLLIMFRLGLPCLTSDIQSYQRIEKLLNTKITCNSIADWSETINLFLKNSEIGEYQSSLGQKYILEHHTEEILLNKWDKAIESVV